MNKRWSVIISSFVVAAIVLGCASYYFLQQRKADKQRADESIARLQKSITDLREAGSPSDWKLYKSDEYGFSFRYPKDWKFDRAISRKGCVMPEVVSPQFVSVAFTYCPDLSSTDIGFPSYEEYVTNESTHMNVGTRYVSGQKFNSYTVENKGDIAITYSYELSVAKDGRFYFINFPEKSFDDLSDAERQILSTFSFSK